MEVIGIDHKKNKGWMIQHRCIRCKKEILNMLAEDDQFTNWIKEKNTFK